MFVFVNFTFFKRYHISRASCLLCPVQRDLSGLLVHAVPASAVLFLYQMSCPVGRVKAFLPRPS
jgi:hypothetical protein